MADGERPIHANARAVPTERRRGDDREVHAKSLHVTSQSSNFIFRTYARIFRIAMVEVSDTAFIKRAPYDRPSSNRTDAMHRDGIDFRYDFANAPRQRFERSPRFSAKLRRMPGRSRALSLSAERSVGENSAESSVSAPDSIASIDRISSSRRKRQRRSRAADRERTCAHRRRSKGTIETP